MSSDSLIAPADLLRFAAVYAAFIVLPGHVVATAANRRSARLARIMLAIPCSYSLVTVYGLISVLLHIPFTASAYAAIAILATLIGAVSIRASSRHAEERGVPRITSAGRPDPEGSWQAPGPEGPPPDHLWSGPCREASASGRSPANKSEVHPGKEERAPASAPGRWWLLPVAVGALDCAICLLLHAGDVVPTAVDALSHATWTQTIARAHVFPIDLLSSHPGAGDGGFYPPTFHAVTAFVGAISGVPAQHAIFLSTLAIILPLPAALFSLVEAMTGSPRLAGLAVLASLAFEPLPLWALAQGLYPFIASCPFIAALVLVLCDGLGRGRAGATGLAALLGVGLFYTHPTEFLTVALLLLTVLPALLGNECRWGRRVLSGALVAGVWLVAALPALAAVHRTMVGGAQVEMRVRHDFVATPHIDLGQVVNAYLYGIYGRNISYLLGVAAAVGLVWCLARRRFLGLALAQVILVAIAADTESANLLHPLYALTFPWALMERLAPTHYWITLPLAAIGLDAALRACKGLLRSRGLAHALLLATPVVALGLLLPLDVAGRHALAYSQARQIMAPADLGALAWLAHHAPADVVIANDGDTSHPELFDTPIDAGRWMPLLSGRTPLFGPGGDGPGTLEDRLYLVQHIADTPLPARAGRFIERYRVLYVFYGAAVPPRATRHLSLSALLRDPRMRLVYASAPRCHGHGARQSPACPAAASYVFAIYSSDL